VRGNDPTRFLAYRPDAIDDLVQEPAFVLHALTKDEAADHNAPREVDAFIAAAVAVPGEVHITRGRKRRPVEVQILLSAFDDSLRDVRRQRGPLLAVGNARIGAILVEWKQMLFD